MARRPVLIIHGGTGNRPDDKRLARIRQRLRAICRAAYGHLQHHAALDSAIYAVSLLEDDPLFNAGTGSSLQRDGKVRMSASVMDGDRLRFSAVLNIERVKNPVLVAKALLDSSDRIVAGSHATSLARRLGFPVWNPISPERLRQWKQRQTDGQTGGTVGAVAVDRAGCLAAATSTGGKGFEQPGRVSDSGLPVGNYANAQAAVSCTGLGEEIIEEGLAVRIAQRVADGRPLPRAVTMTFREARTRRRRLGLIALDRHGRITWATTQPILLAIAQTPRQLLESF